MPNWVKSERVELKDNKNTYFRGISSFFDEKGDTRQVIYNYEEDKRLLSRGQTNISIALSDALDASKATSGLYVRNDSDGQVSDYKFVVSQYT